MEENMKLWDVVKRPPETALKQITGGRLGKAGMINIDPQWRYQAITEQFGPCGAGWYYTLEDRWVVDGNAGEMVQYAHVLFYYNQGGEWSKGIPGTGGSMLIAKERDGLRTNDEALKMAVTDALSCSLKLLGVAADVYMGKFDGTKYKDDPPPNQGAGKPLDQQLKYLNQLLTKHKINRTKWKEYILHYWNATSATDLVIDQYDAAVIIVTKKPNDINNFNRSPEWSV